MRLQGVRKAWVAAVACAVLALACGAAGGGGADARSDTGADVGADVFPDGALADARETAGEVALDVPTDPSPEAAPEPAIEIAPEIAQEVAEEAVQETAGEDQVEEAEVNPVTGTLTLDPATLLFGSLPIGSYRPMISGYDPVARTCVSLIWYYDSPWSGGFCDTFPSFMAYAIVTPDTDGPCGQWEYGGDVAITALDGCADWAEFGPGHLDLADFTATLTPGEGSALAGPLTVAVDSRSVATPPPVTLGLRYSTDIPEDVWIQSGDAYGLPDWVHVSRDGQRLVLFDRCDVPVCGEGGGVCGLAFQKVTNLTNTSYGGDAFLSWDGRMRVEDPALHCWKREAAPPGEYEVEACFAWATEETDAGTVVKNPYCVKQTFTLPGDEWIVVASMGG